MFITDSGKFPLIGKGANRKLGMYQFIFQMLSKSQDHITLVSKQAIATDFLVPAFISIFSKSDILINGPNHKPTNKT